MSDITAAEHPAPATNVAPHRLRWLAWLLLYAIAVVYSSLVLGPVGFHFVPEDPAVVWQAFLQTPYVENGSDQRPDWIANLLDLIPVGFLLAGIVWPYRWRWLRPFAALSALFVGIVFVLAVKYAQLFFPPRTVTLNYIMAQGIGVIAGVALLWWWRTSLSRFVARQFAGGNGLAIALGAYTIALIAYALVPFDIVLSAGDLHERLAALPALLKGMPAPERSRGIRIVLVLVSTLATIPMGMLLALLLPRASLLWHGLVGLLLMAAVTAAEAGELSGAPHLVAIGYRTVGIVLGVLVLRGLRAQDPARLRAGLARLVPVLVLPYIAAVLFVNGLLTRGWRTVPEAMAALEWRGLVPFWHWYIVTKMHAAQGLVVHAATFAPIGVMIWLRRGRTRGGAWLAAALAVPFSLAMEVGRWFKPELQPDFNDLLVAGVAAVVAYLAMPRIWRLCEQAIWPAVAPHARAVLPARRVSVLGVFVAAACVGLGALAVARYPLGPWWLGGGLLVYAAVLWRWPWAWMVAVPFALPCLDLSPWTGWLLVGESDLVVLVTVAVLLLRDPPARGEWWPRGWAGVVLAIATVVMVVGLGLGLALPVLEPGGTSSIYLSPLNALRVAKGFFTALALLPFLMRAVAGGGAGLFGYGMVAGVLGVAAAAVVERLAFTGPFDFVTDYRVLGPFASEHIGGGHIGAYLAMALPFLAVPLIRPRIFGVLLALAGAIGGGYALVVTSSRTGYAVGAVGIALVALLWPLAHLRGARARRLAAFIPVPLLLVLGGLVIVAATRTEYMAARFKTVVPDLELRTSNWQAGLAARERGLRGVLFGAGIGTYPRLAAARESGRAVPSNFVIVAERGEKFLSALVRSRDYFGQKISLPPAGPLHLRLALRPHGAAAAATAIMCAKWLLYSQDCVSVPLPAPVAEQWNEAAADFSEAMLAPLRQHRPVPRPVDLSFDFPHGQAMDFARASLQDAAGNELITNGGFTDGTARWLFTDDDDTAWRIMNLYLQLFFEGGAIGVAAFLLLVGAAGFSAFGAILRGERMGVPIVASLLAFLAAGMMDGLIEAPRLDAVFFLVALLGLAIRRPA